jgi:hypothetical protein
LPKQLIIVIGLKLLGSSLSLLLLYNGIVFPDNQSSGIQPLPFTYLGLNFSRTGSFTNAKKVLINKAYKAMFEVLKRGRLHKLSIKSQYDLFDKIVKPILLYECEIWGFGNIDIYIE